jgi:hypothetical protein
MSEKAIYDEETGDFLHIEEDEFVECDEKCCALLEPATLEEYRATLTHYKSHSYQCGCSHGR